jgi:hypothetical protein
MNTVNYRYLHRVLALTGILLVIAQTIFGIYQQHNFSTHYNNLNVMGIGVGVFSLAYFLLHAYWWKSSLKRELLGGFMAISAFAMVLLVTRIIDLREQSDNDSMIGNFIQKMADAVFALKRPSPNWLNTLMDGFSVAVPSLAIICLVLLVFVKPADVVEPERVPELKKRGIVLWHYAASILGMLLLLAFLGAGYYEETNYPGGFNLHIFRDWKIWVASLVPLLHFILNMIWYRVNCKRELTGAFFVVAASAIILLCSIIISVIADATRSSSGGSQLFDGLFKNNHPPPVWLINLRDFSGIGVLLLVIVCFLLLWQIGKKRLWQRELNA